MTAVLELAAVRKTYAGGVEALRGITLAVHAGELVGVVGPSGSGKSTLLHVMGTLERPTDGVVRVSGHETSDLGDAALAAIRSRLIGFVFQQFFLLDGMSALDNVANGLLYTGANASERRSRAKEMRERVGLGHRVGQSAAKLSGGERQRVAIARALAGEPECVLADEPTGNLDRETADGVFALMLDLARSRSMAFVLVSHDETLARRCDRLLRLTKGRLAA